MILKNHDLPFAQKEPNIREGFMADHYDDSWRVIIDGIRRKRGIFNRSKLFDFMKFYKNFRNNYQLFYFYIQR